MKQIAKLPLVIIPAVLLIFALGALSGYFYFQKSQSKVLSVATSQDPHVDFLDEVYDKIKENYWDKISDENLTTLFKLGTEKLTGNPLEIKTLNKEGLNQTLERVINSMGADKRKEFTTNLANLVLTNLSPYGRNALYTSKQETTLRNNVSNINPEKDLYQDLGVRKGSSQEEIKSVYEENKKRLEKESSPEAARKLDDLTYAYNVLSNEQKKEGYDKAGVEPTISARLISQKVLYLPIQKVSPTTFDEIQRETENFKDIEGLSSLILDLRGNIGGSIDLLPYLIGPFIGQNQYAYELFHQGETTPIKTKTGFLPSLLRYKKVAILFDGQTQSSAEVLAATLKKYNVGVTVGITTKGWGTVEKVFPLDHQIDPNEKYSAFLVHSLTLRDDGQPIEGRGVEPLINIKDQNWKNQLNEYFNSTELAQAIDDLINPK